MTNFPCLKFFSKSREVELAGNYIFMVCLVWIIFGYLKWEGMSISMEYLFICLKEYLFHQDE